MNFGSVFRYRKGYIMKSKSKNKLFTKDFTILAVGQLISLFGNALQRYALSLYILDLTGSAAIFSTLLALSIIPQIIFSPIGGALADRKNKKHIMVILDFFSGFMLLAFYLFSSAVSNQIVLIGIVLCTLALIQSFYDPTVRASIPAITGKENLASANSIVNEISAVTSLTGPVAAGFSYGFFGIKVVFLINIISFIFSAIMELFLSIPFEKTVMEKGTLHTISSDLKESIHYLIHEQRLILYMILVASSLNLFLTPLYTVGFPYIEKVIFGISSQLYGISEGFIYVGMITGSILVGFASKHIPMAKIHLYFSLIAVVVLLMGLPTLTIFMNPSGPSYLSYVLFTFIGFLFSILLALLNIICMTFMQLQTPQDKMGKIMALVSSVSASLMPLGQIIFGGLFTALDGKLIILYIISALIMMFISRLVLTLMSRHYKETEVATTIN